MLFDSLLAGKHVRCYGVLYYRHEDTGVLYVFPFPRMHLFSISRRQNACALNA
jgi:hypothetical protein